MLSKITPPSTARYRRQLTDPTVSGRADFYDPANADAVRQVHLPV